MKSKRYSIGEIARLGILKNTRGEIYRHKATISRVLVKRFPELLKRPTPFGLGYEIAQSMIDTLNAENAAYSV